MQYRQAADMTNILGKQHKKIFTKVRRKQENFLWMLDSMYKLPRAKLQLGSSAFRSGAEVNRRASVPAVWTKGSSYTRYQKPVSNI